MRTGRRRCRRRAPDTPGGGAHRSRSGKVVPVRHPARRRTWCGRCARGRGTASGRASRRRGRGPSPEGGVRVPRRRHRRGPSRRPRGSTLRRSGSREVARGGRSHGWRPRSRVPDGLRGPRIDTEAWRVAGRRGLQTRHRNRTSACRPREGASVAAGLPLRSESWLIGRAYRTLTVDDDGHLVGVPRIGNRPGVGHVLRKDRRQTSSATGREDGRHGGLRGRVVKVDRLSAQIGRPLMRNCEPAVVVGP